MPTDDLEMLVERALYGEAATMHRAVLTLAERVREAEEERDRLRFILAGVGPEPSRDVADLVEDLRACQESEHEAGQLLRQMVHQVRRTGARLAEAERLLRGCSREIGGGIFKEVRAFLDQEEA